MTERGHHAGQQFGNYHLLHLLGRGGFAEVYLGAHIHLETQAAVKVLHVQLGSQGLEQFRQEARTIAHLHHPHIVRVLEFGIEATTPFLVMDHAPGGTLRVVHPKGTRLPLERIVSYVKQVAAALQYAHEQHIIHRDVKPENMLLGTHQEIMLSDFGIAVLQQATSSLPTQKPAGTPLYMAPEQIMGRPRAASDQYALAVVAYEWLCGEPPFHGSLYELWSQHLHRPPPLLREKVPELPATVEDSILGALAKDPQQRFVSVQEFAEVLEQSSLPTHPSSPPLPAIILPQPFPRPVDESSSPTAPPVQPGVTAPPHVQSRSLLRKGIMQYLRSIQARYTSITLPLGPVEGFSLQAVFQPLTLRRDPRAAEDREREERRHLFGEAMLDENLPAVIADNGEDALAKSPQGRIVILGGPGTGKTTLLQSLMSDRLQKAQADLTAFLPLFISLPDLARSGKTLQEYLIRLSKEVGLADRSTDIKSV
jgi:serine/threonine protein kinase